LNLSLAHIWLHYSYNQGISFQHSRRPPQIFIGFRFFWFLMLKNRPEPKKIDSWFGLGYINKKYYFPAWLNFWVKTGLWTPLLKTLKHNPFLFKCKNSINVYKIQTLKYVWMLFMFSNDEGFYNGGGFIFVDVEKIFDFGC